MRDLCKARIVITPAQELNKRHLCKYEQVHFDLLISNVNFCRSEGDKLVLVVKVRVQIDDHAS
ncbi:hypothetical protein J6590_088105 [Homalodisca vitripennis]|nr:hypothetical protein J6590_088105 [Homalodisca vitripennis]